MLAEAALLRTADELGTADNRFDDKRLDELPMKKGVAAQNDFEEAFNFDPRHPISEGAKSKTRDSAIMCHEKKRSASDKMPDNV